MIDYEQAEDFNTKQIAEAKLTIGDITKLVVFFQTHIKVMRGLSIAVDGKAGNQETIPALRAEFPTISTFPEPRIWPLKALPDGRKPLVTSGFFKRNPSRPNHMGVDLFYDYVLGTDPPLKVGDGGRTSKFWIPNNHPAVAVADGTITAATWTTTGFFVRLVPKGATVSMGYFHLSSMLVAVGQSVKAGQPIGIVGDNPADNDARHLHFEVYQSTTGWNRLDPEDRFLPGAIVLTT